MTSKASGDCLGDGRFNKKQNEGWCERQSVHLCALRHHSLEVGQEGDYV